MDQANSISDPSQILILEFPVPRDFLPPLPSLFNFALADWNPYHVLNRFPYFVLTHSTTCHHKYWIYKNIWQAKPTKFIIKLYPDHNSLWVSHATHQKAESLRASFLSKLHIMVNSSSISNTKFVDFSTEWYVLLHYSNPTCVYNHSFNLRQESVHLLQSTFTSLFHTCSQNYPYNPQ